MQILTLSLKNEQNEIAQSADYINLLRRQKFIIKWMIYAVNIINLGVNEISRGWTGLRNFHEELKNWTDPQRKGKFEES